jgi:aspartate carbamoyltransferase catalytic subunit
MFQFWVLMPSKIGTVDFFLEVVIFHNSFARADILYITQIPKDHFGDRIDDYEQSKEIFRINQNLMKVLKKDTFIMHPFPRGYELPTEIDRDPRAIYFAQVKYGQCLRMGLLYYVFGVDAG